MKNCNFVNSSLVSEIEMTFLPDIFLSHILIMICKARQVCRTFNYSFSCAVLPKLWTILISAINGADSFLEHKLKRIEVKPLFSHKNL